MHLNTINKKPTILFCLYRNWADECARRVQRNCYNNANYFYCWDEKTLEEKVGRLNPDIIVCIGWSWKIPKEIVNSKLVIGCHPSDLPKYAGGSPIQNQIIDGIEKTKNTLFKLSEKFDDGAIIDKDDLDLTGNMQHVLDKISDSCERLLIKFIKNYPNFELKEQTESNISNKKRLKEEDGKLSKELISNMSSKQLYNFMRCRESPYPNCYIEDDEGILYFEKVRYVKK